jgi:phospholipase C
MPLDAVKTIVVLMQENRSFDHMLGYLSLPPWNRSNVDGLKIDPASLIGYTNTSNGQGYLPYRLPSPGATLPDDPIHDRGHIATQMGAPVGGVFPMNGFVNSCPTIDPQSNMPMVMGYFNAEDLPTTHFFAENFAICDKWFSSIPASTQPNRLMSMAGYTTIDNNKDIIPSQKLVYDWLEDHKVRWRVYHDSIPFFALMPEWYPWILLDHDFRDFSRLFEDIQNEGDETFPQVIFIEPRFTDAPHIETPNDDHAPSAITPGQDFMAKVYSALTSNTERWAGMVFVVTYDEHGGFFDHASPPAMPTNPPAGAAYAPFTTLGCRVPGFVISPLVEKSSVYSGCLDHTSILKFIADKFSGGTGYSPEVDGRPVGSLSDVLAALTPNGGPRTDVPVLASVDVGFSPDGTPPALTDSNLTPMGFSKALDGLRDYDKDVTATKFPKIADRF